VASDESPETARSLSQRLLAIASRGRLEERELRRIAVNFIRAHDDQGALALIEQQLRERPDLERNASIRQLRGDALLGLAKRCRITAKQIRTPQATKQRAWREFHAYLDRAERDLREALAMSVDAGLTEQIHRNLDFLERFRADNQPPRGRRR
jgi:hypothetical protein